jgi:hypothetical protein
MLRELLLAAPVSDAILTIDGKTVHARKLTGLEVIESKIASSADASQAEKQLSLARLIVSGVVDSAGTRVFADSDVDAVAAMPYAVFMKLVDGITKHNGMGEAAGNSSAPSTDAS